jgi:hypothetical protein
VLGVVVSRIRAVRPIPFMIEDKDSGAVMGGSVRDSAFVVDPEAGPERDGHSRTNTYIGTPRGSVVLDAR